MVWRPTLCISGGQSGVDRALLIAAKRVGIPTGGYLPAGLVTEDNVGPKKEFGLLESEGSYKHRDCQNVDWTDALVALRLTRPLTGRGTEKTVQYALTGRYKHIPLEPPPEGTVGAFEVIRTGKKPVLVLWDVTENSLVQHVPVIKAFLEEFKPKTLMASGSTERTEPGTCRCASELFALALASG
eukprot:TRINITY_DN20098_c0_g1_i2.p1 TRINITY_DN20098_c0_g1~~TRINITY_DN20098_c0_g1_i2.p1  ORF type:complete len:185 (+),score=17.12 TRINITY_DN20098_c0_g1_i2:29-583(+)